MKNLILTVLFALVPITALAQALPTTRITAADMEYVGAFRLPEASGPGGETGDANSFNGGGEALTFNPTTGALMLTGARCCTPTTVAEVNIPEIRNVTSIGALARATYRQPHTDILRGKQRDVGCGGPLGGLLPYGGRLIASVYCYYDAGYVQNSSHFVSGLNFGSLPTVLGPIEVQSPATGGGRAGFVSNYMGVIPAEWRAAFGGNALVGNCCVPIITRTSWGPAISVVSAEDFGVRNPVPAINVLSYPTGHPLDGDAECAATSRLFNCNTAIASVLFVPGTSSVLFFGTQGTGEACYGFGTSDPALHLQPVRDRSDANPAVDHYCYDPAAGSKGGHAYPYQHWVWAYDANELLAVKNGQKQPWEVRPYAVWGYDTPFQVTRRGVGGVAYDPATQRLFISASEQDAPRPLVQVFRLNIPTGGPSPTPVDAVVSAWSEWGGGAWSTCTAGTQSRTETRTRTVVTPASNGGTTPSLSETRPATRTCGVTPPADTQPPTAAILSPTPGQVLRGPTVFGASGSDNVGIVSLETLIDGVVRQTTPGPVFPVSVAFDSNALPDGPHTIRLVVRDAAGNAFTTEPVAFSVQNAVAPPPPPPPVNAVVSDWVRSQAGEWSPCASGQQTRQETWTRAVITPASNGGTTPPLSEARTGTQSCAMPVPDPVGLAGVVSEVKAEETCTVSGPWWNRKTTCVPTGAFFVTVKVKGQPALRPGQSVTVR